MQTFTAREDFGAEGDGVVDVVFDLVESAGVDEGAVGAAGEGVGECG